MFVYATRNDDEHMPEPSQKYSHIELPVVIKTGYTTSDIPRWNPEMGERNPPRKGLSCPTQVGKWNQFFYIGCNSKPDMLKIENYINGAKGGPFTKETCWAGRSKVLVNPGRELVYTQWYVLKELYRDIVESPEKYGLSEDACLWFVDEDGRRDDEHAIDPDTEEVSAPRIQRRVHRRRNTSTTKEDQQEIYKNALGEESPIYNHMINNWENKPYYRYSKPFEHAINHQEILFVDHLNIPPHRVDMALDLANPTSIKYWVNEIKYITRKKKMEYRERGITLPNENVTFGNGKLLALLNTHILRGYYNI